MAQTPFWLKDSSKSGSNRGLDALKNPFTFAGRTAGGLFGSVDDIVRGVGRMGGALLSDLALEPVRGIASALGRPISGDPGFWRDHDTGTFRPSSYQDLVLPMARSAANTVDTANDLTFNLFNPVEG